MEEQAEAYGEYFASIEVGTPKSAIALCEEAMRRQRRVIAEMRPPRPEDIATRNSLETSARRGKRGRAAGHDGVPQELYGVDPRLTALRLLPLRSRR